MNIVNNGIYSGATSTALNITGALINMNGYQYRCSVSSACSNTISSAVTLTVNPLVTPTVTIAASPNPICSGNTSIFSAVPVNGGATPSYQWNKNNINVGGNNAVYTDNAVNNGDIIKCTLTSNAVCPTATTATSNLITMSVFNGSPNMRYPTVNAYNVQQIQLQARTITGANYLWTPPLGLNSNTIYNPVFSYNQSQEYNVRITSPNGCINVDTLLVTVIKNKDIYVPKAFSPDNNGVNDKLYPILVGIKELRYFRVFNRWGNLIFETTSGNPALGWDGTFKGKAQPVETYSWIAEGVDIDGFTIKRGGSTLLIR